MSPAEQDPATTHEFDRLLRRFGGETFEKLPTKVKAAPRSGRKAGEGEWDESKVKRGTGEKGGQFIPKGEGSGSGKGDDKKMTKAQRKRVMVEAILDALDDVFQELTSKQARALIMQIEDNAAAFIDGQERSGGGGGGGGGSKKGGAKGGSGGSKKGADGSGGGGSKKDSTPSRKDRPGGMEGVIAGVKSLIKNFGKNMKPATRKKLEKSVKSLDSMATLATLMTFAEDDEYDSTVCIMAVPAAGDPVHGIGAEDKHATLLYFGDIEEHGDPERMESSKGLLMEVLAVASAEMEPFTARVTKIQPLGHDDTPAQVWLLDSPELTRLFEEIPGIDSEVHSLYEDADATRYPEYLPHVTIDYSDDRPDEASTITEIRFDRLSLWWGNEHIDFPLGSAEFDALLEVFA